MEKHISIVRFAVEADVFDPAGAVDPQDLLAAVHKVCPTAYLVGDVSVTPMQPDDD